MDKLEFKNVVAFIILMQNGTGLMDKSPEYIIEKYFMCQEKAYFGETEIKHKEECWGLSDKQQAKVKEYFIKWIPYG